MLAVAAVNPAPASPAATHAAPVAAQAVPGPGQGVKTQTTVAVQETAPVRFNPHTVYDDDIKKVLVQIRDDQGEVTTQYPSEQAVREYRRHQQEQTKGDGASGKPARDAGASDKADGGPPTVTVEAAAFPTPSTNPQVEITV
ncbi:MAG: hypothetical protein PHS60_11145 [Zavarzinia sp.]|nr:hypothetical protein [Zavarzinia sp.]